ATSIRQPLCTLSARQPCGVSVSARAVTYLGAPSATARPLRWQRSSAASAVTNGGRPRGTKLWRPPRGRKAPEGGWDRPSPPPGPGPPWGRAPPRERVGAGEEGGGGRAGRRDAGGEVGGGVQEPDLGAGGDGEAVGGDGQAHGALEVVVRQGQLARRDADSGDLARLVGGHQQGDAELAQEWRQPARVIVANFARRRGARPFGRRGAAGGAPPPGLAFFR